MSENATSALDPRKWRRLSDAEASWMNDPNGCWRCVRATPDGEHRYLDPGEVLMQPGVEMAVGPLDDWTPEIEAAPDRLVARDEWRAFRVPLPPRDAGAHEVAVPTETEALVVALEAAP